MKKKLLSKKTLSLVLATIMLLSLLPIGVLADTWTVVQSEESSGYIYKYAGVKTAPNGADLEDALNYLLVPTEGGPEVRADLYKYQLTDIESKVPFDVYCSDYDVQTNDNGVLYRRTPIEMSELGITPEQANRLRAILLNSDLWITLETMRENSKVAGLTQGEAIAAVQYAIWSVVNKATLKANPFGGALDNENVKDYARMLLDLSGVEAGEVAYIDIMGPIIKTKVPGESQLYDVTIYYEIKGPGAEGFSAEVVTAASYKKATGGTVLVAAGDIDSEDGTVVIRNVPISAELEVMLTSTNNNMKNVYLYESYGGHKYSQTFVGVANENVPLITKVEVNSPGELFNLEIFKDWQNESYVTISNNAVESYTAEFEFTYANGPYKGQKVITENPRIKGNGSHTTGYVFEADKPEEVGKPKKERLYKVEEIDAKAGDKSVTGEGAEKYFKFDANGTVIWTDADGNPITEGSARFANIIEMQTGSVAVTKTVTNAGSMPGEKDEPFKFEILSGGDPLANEAFDIYDSEVKVDDGITDADGFFYIQQGQTALFQGLPVGSSIVVNELENAGNKVRYNFVDDSGSCIVEDGKRHDIKIVNTLRLGNLTIDKAFAEGGEIDWDSFLDGHEIIFTVKYPDGVTVEEFPLTKPATQIVLTDVPLGVYTITEKTDGVNSAKVDGYKITSDTTLSETVYEGDTATVSFTNTYEKEQAKLTLKKSVDLSDSNLTDEQIEGINNLTFEFTVKDSGGNIVATETLKHGDYKTLTLVPDTYTITETVVGNTGALSQVNHIISVSGDDATYDDSERKITVELEDLDVKTVTVTNTYTKQVGKLEIIKKLSDGIDKGKFAIDAFNFTVTDSSGKVVADFSLPKTGGVWSHTITGLAPGNYTVTETQPTDAPENYTFNSTTGSGDVYEVKENVTTTAEITNNYERQTGSVTFEKVVEGLDSGNAHFTVAIMDDGNPWNGTAKYTVTNGTTTSEAADITNGGTISGIKHGDIITITDLPKGAEVTVTETNNGHYTVNPYNRTHTFKVGMDTIKTFINTFRTIDITVEKTLVNATWDQFEDGIQFEITGPAGWDGSYTDANDNPDTLTPVPGKDYTYLLTILPSSSGEDPTRNVVLKGLPSGSYKVTEVADSAKLDNFDTTVDIDVVGAFNDGSGNTYSKVPTEGYVEATAYTTNPIFKFKNTYGVGPGTLFITKNVIGEVAGRWYEITVTVNGTTPDDFDGSKIAVSGENLVTESGFKAVWENGKFVFYISGAGKFTITGIPSGYFYKVEETKIIKASDKDKTDIKEDQYTITYGSENGSSDPLIINISDGAGRQGNASIYNKRFTDTTVTVEKTVNGAYDGEEFTFTVKVDGNLWDGYYSIGVGNNIKMTNGVLKLTNGQTAELINVPRGAVVEVTETENSLYTTSYKVNGGTATDDNKASDTTRLNITSSFEFINTRKTGNLSITKATSGDADAISAMSGRAYTFTLKRGDTVITGENFAITSERADRTKDKTSETGTFILYAGETAVFTGLPAGSYTVVENTVTTPDGIDWEKSGDGTVSVSNGDNPMIVTNKFTYKTGSLTVKKTASLQGTQPSWDTPQINGPFTFTLYDSSGNTVTGFKYKIGSEKEETSTDGTFQLENGQTATITGLRNGSYYVVEYYDAPEGYTVDTTYNDKKIGKDAAQSVSELATAEIEVENTFTRGFGDLTVTKNEEVDNRGAFPANKEYTFTLYAGAVAENNKVTNFDYKIGDDDKGIGTDGTFTLKHNDTAVFTNLPAGIYYVVESDADVVGYTPKVTGDGKVKVEKEKTTEVKVTNSYTRITGNLTINKAVTQNTHAPSEWEFNFTITSTATDWDGSYNDEHGDPFKLAPAEGGGYTLTLTDDATGITLYGLPGGSYTVTEDVDSATQVPDCRIGTKANTAESNFAIVSVGNTSVKAEFVNTYSLIGAYLNLTKKLEGASFENAKPISFKLEVLKSGEYELLETLTVPTEQGWKVEKELPEGSYRIKEDITTVNIGGVTFMGVSYAGKNNPDGSNNYLDADEDGWLYFDIEDKANIDVTATNHYMKDGGILRVTKEVEGYAGGDDFGFRIEGANPATDQQNGFKYYKDSESGPYYTDELGYFRLKAGETAEFRELEIGSNYTVTEVNDSAADNAHMEYYDLTDVSGESFTFTVGTEGITRTSPESADIDWTEGDYSVSLKFERESGDSFPGMDITFTNTRLLGSLTVEKELVGNLSADFKINISFSYNGTTVDLSSIDSITVNNLNRDTTDLSNTLTVTVPAGGSVEIGGLPLGLSYEVSEQFSGSEEAEIYDVTYTNREGVIGDGHDSTVTNKVQYGQLTVHKFVRGISTNEAFNITVTLTPATGVAFTQETLDDLVFTVGPSSSKLVGGEIVIQLALAHGEKSAIKNIPLGTKYEVSENLGAGSYYQNMIFGAKGTVHADDTTNKILYSECIARVYNFYIPDNGLLIGKDVEATPGSPMQTWRFNFTLQFFEPGEKTGDQEKRIMEQYDKAVKQLEEVTALAAQAQRWLSENEWTDADGEAYAEAERNLQAAIAMADQMQETCDGCDGLGEVSVQGDCPDCSGNVTVPVEVPCPDCNGEGTGCQPCGESGYIIEQQDCGSCNGSGKAEPSMAPCPDCSSAVATAKAQAQAEYDSAPAVKKHAEIQANTEAYEKAIKNMATLEDFKTILGFERKYIEWDEDFNEIDLGDDVEFMFESFEELAELVTVSNEEGSLTLSDVDFRYDAVTGEITFTLAAGETLVFDGLPEGISYKITEGGYLDGGGTYDSTIITVGNSTYNSVSTPQLTLNKEGNNNHTVKFLNKYKEVMGSLTVIKNWPNGVGADSVAIQLFKGIEAYGAPATLRESNGWSHTFPDLKLDGSVYSVKEMDAPTGYLVSYSSQGIELSYDVRSGTITVTNSFVPPWVPPIGPDPDPEPEPEPPVDIGDPEDPLAPAEPPVEIPEEETPLDIYDPEDPLGDAPKTGDNTPLAALWAVFGASAIGLAALLFPRKKKQGDIPA